MKHRDLFSDRAEVYAKYRPTYPREIFPFLSSLVKEHKLAWDCATGNGQTAYSLTPYFERVVATDSSDEQIAHAKQHPKIIYKVSLAEKTDFNNQCIDLITVSVAAHWFDLDKFYQEVRRILKPSGVIAIWCYSLFQTQDLSIDTILNRLLHEITGPYWPEERRYVNELYRTIPFPFEEITGPKFEMTTNWDFNRVCGYIQTWTGYIKYKEATGKDPLALVMAEFLNAWGNPKQKRKLYWPLGMRVGKV